MVSNPTHSRTELKRSLRGKSLPGFKPCQSSNTAKTIKEKAQLMNKRIIIAYPSKNTFWMIFAIE
jgi:hypothetical protein